MPAGTRGAGSQSAARTSTRSASCMPHRPAFPHHPEAIGELEHACGAARGVPRESAHLDGRPHGRQRLRSPVPARQRSAGISAPCITRVHELRSIFLASIPQVRLQEFVMDRNRVVGAIRAAAETCEATADHAQRASQLLACAATGCTIFSTSFTRNCAQSGSHARPWV